MDKSWEDSMKKKKIQTCQVQPRKGSFLIAPTSCGVSGQARV